MENPIYIVDEIAAIVAKVQTALLTELQAYDPLIEGVHYEYGPGKEILETLKQKDMAPSFRNKKYPLVALLMEFPETRNPTIGVYAEADLSLVFCHHTKIDYKTAERYEKTFKPVLYPIYLKFMHELEMSGIAFSQTGEYEHQKVDCPYYGRENKNVGNDFLDAIEVNNLKIRLYQKSC